MLSADAAPVLPAETSRLQRLSVLQLGSSLLATLGLWMVALFVASMGLLQLAAGPQLTSAAEPLLLWAAGVSFVGLLILPSAYFALRRLSGGAPTEALKPLTSQHLFAATMVMILVFPALLFLGERVLPNTRREWLWLPLLHIVAVTLPIIWLYTLGSRSISPGSAQRFWGALASGLMVGPSLILLLELLALVVFVAVVAVYLSSNAELLAEMTRLWQRLSHAPNPYVAQSIIRPYLQKPYVIAAVLGYAALVIPLIEELLKPIAAWLLVHRGLTPAQGFMAGLLSGAGYALFESLMLATAGGEWAMLVAARVGTGLLHVTTSALMGWAIAVAWRRGGWAGFLRLLGAYFGVVFLHGLWNGLTLFLTWSVFLQGAEETLDAIFRVGGVAAVGLGVLAGLFLAMLAGANWLVRREG
jgi:hypothetical protein